MQYIIVENFGKELKQMRIHENLTQEELAKKSSVHINTISSIENEKLTPDFSTIEKLMLAFGNKYKINLAIQDMNGNLTTNIPKRKKRF